MSWIIAITAILFAIGYWHIPLLTFMTVTFAGIGTALIFGAPLFWILVLAESSLLCWSLDDDNSDGIETISILIVLLLLQFFGNVKVFTYLWYHPWKSVTYITGYLLIGGGWSIIKWWFAETAKLSSVRAKFFSRHNIRGFEIPPEFKDRWSDEVSAQKTNPSAQQSRFLTWIAYWPWSLFWTMVNDPLKRAARRIYYELQATYQRITDRVWRV
jgi:hypothetical protein